MYYYSVICLQYVILSSVTEFTKFCECKCIKVHFIRLIKKFQIDEELNYDSVKLASHDFLKRKEVHFDVKVSGGNVFILNKINTYYNIYAINNYKTSF